MMMRLYFLIWTNFCSEIIWPLVVCSSKWKNSRKYVWVRISKSYLEIQFCGNPVFPESHFSRTSVFWNIKTADAPESRDSGKSEKFRLTVICLGIFQVSVQMEQDKPKNEIAPGSTSDKKEEKNENSGNWNRKYFWNFRLLKIDYT